MFSPDHEKAAGELARVCRPGGRIGLANWTPAGFIGELFKVLGRHAPPLAGLQSPALWGSEPHLKAFLASRPRTSPSPGACSIFGIDRPRTSSRFFAPGTGRCTGRSPRCRRSTRTRCRRSSRRFSRTRIEAAPNAHRPEGISRDRDHARRDRGAPGWKQSFSAGFSATVGTSPRANTSRCGKPSWPRTGGACPGIRACRRQRVLDVARGTGLSPSRPRRGRAAGSVLGVDLSAAMVDAARGCERSRSNAYFLRMDAEALGCRRGFDAVLCGLGLMYLPDPGRALREMRRVVKPGGRIGLAYGENAPVADGRRSSHRRGRGSERGVSTFFSSEKQTARSALCGRRFRDPSQEVLRRLWLTECGHGMRRRVRRRTGRARLVALRLRGARACLPRYLDAIAPWRRGEGFRVPAEFLILGAEKARRPL